jgi:hypothetical protein
VIPDSKVVELLLQRAWHATEDRPQTAEQTYAEIFARADSSPRQKAIAAYNAGMHRARAGDDVAAIRHWSRVDTLPSVPFFLSGIAGIRRAAVRYRMGDAAGAVCDCTAVITQAAILETHQEAVLDARVYVPPEWSPLELLAMALVDRGRARGYLGDDAGALADIASAQGMAGVSPQTIARGWARLAEVHLWAARYAQVPEAARAARRAQDVRVLAAFALLALGRSGEAVYECDQGLPWVRSGRRLDVYETHLADLVRRCGEVPADALQEIRDRLRWRREELDRYAPTRVSDADW